MLRAIGIFINSEAGARLTGKLRMQSSGDTLLRILRQATEMAFPTPRVLGVDDWAQKKRQTYGTILVDLERQRVVDLLPDRTAETQQPNLNWCNRGPIVPSIWSAVF